MSEPLKAISDVFEIDCVADVGLRQQYIDSAIARGLPRVTARARRRGKVAIVASGPSVTEYVDLLKSFDGEIWGINRSVEWMRHRGIKPTAFIGIDPEWFLKECLPEPPKELTYYLGSQVHPCVFDWLKDCNVKLWFLADSEVKLPPDAYPIFGGSTALSRAPNLAYALGYREVHIFGGDSSFTHKTHVHGGDLPANWIPVELNGEMFRTTRSMLAQASAFIEQMVEWARGKDPLSVSLYGEGLMQSLYKQTLESGAYAAYLAEEFKDEVGLNRAQRRARRSGRVAA